MVKSGIQYILHPGRILVRLAHKGILPMDDRKYIERLFEERLGYPLNLDRPETFNEKIQWLKLNDRKKIYTEFADKCEVKKHIESILGNEYIIPTIGEWERFRDIDFEKLPDKFVLKCTHDSGSAIIVKDKKQFNIKEANKKIEKLLKRNYFYPGREWPYLNIKPKIIVEQYISDSKNELNDYKVFLFGGKAAYIQVDYDRFTDHHRNFYDTDWNYVPFTTCYPTNPMHAIEKPECLNKLIVCAEKIAMALNNPSFLRVDFYIVDGKILFGEVTFHHGSGWEKFYPMEYEYILGKQIKLLAK